MSPHQVPQSLRDFHDHLDACKRCREQPFNLCVTGDRLIRATVDTQFERPMPMNVEKVRR